MVGSARVQFSRMEKGFEILMGGVGVLCRISVITSYGRSLREVETSLGLECLGLVAGCFLDRGLACWSIWFMVFSG